MREKRRQRGSLNKVSSSTGMCHSHMLRKAEALWCVSSVGRFVANDKSEHIDKHTQETNITVSYVGRHSLVMHSVTLT
jgi:hypothetical protein